MRDKFNLIFIIGCEGTGHHLFEQCKLTPKPYKVLHKLIMEYFNINTNPIKQKEIKTKIYNITKNNIGAVCKESCSFPYSRPKNPLKSLDILGFLNYLIKCHMLTSFILFLREI